MRVAATRPEMLLLLGSAAALLGSATLASDGVLPGAPPLARRLTATQYRLAIEDVFGPHIHVDGQFEPDLREAGL